MLPATLVTILSFLLKFSSTTSAYSMQPTYIIANIGSSGRNIRNLQCISKKNNEKGICMFAIDCLKANGTHLGTCIDGFYFGSCCHIKPLNDVNGNTIDTAIIPSREPPSRITSTTKRPTSKIVETTQQSTTTTTTKATTTSTPITTRQTPLTNRTTNVPETTTLSFKLSTFQSIEKNPVIYTVLTKAPQTLTTPTPLTTKSQPPLTTTKLKTTTPKSVITKPTKLSKPTTTSIRTTKPTKIVTKPTKPSITTKKPITKITTKIPTTTSSKIKIASSVTTSEKTTTVKLTTTTEKTTTKLNLTETSNAEVIGNTATNEIEHVVPVQPSSTTEGSNVPSFITWSVLGQETTKPTTTPQQEWKPLTTPDGWVLLPSLTTVLPVINDTVRNVTENPTTISTEKLVELSTANVTTITYSTGESVTVNGTHLSSSSTETVPITSNATTAFSPSTTEMNISPAVNMSDFTDVCGRRMYPEARIVGGERATFGKWPWQISLRQWRTSTYLHKCGAALLNENWAITAAHCVDNVPPSDLLLRLGEHDLSTDNEPYIHQERRVQIVAAHPQFDPRTFEYDLALLRFYEPIVFQPNIVPVCVPNNDENFVGRTAFVTGWGRLYEDGPLPSVLQQVAVPVINNTVCEAMYRSAGYIEHIPHIFICAGWRRGGFDSCEGDSGGPMVIQREDKRFLLAGVISWGIGCAEPNQPGVYTRISEFRDWINQILQF
ncbi:hypothetical protein FQR65_LT00406 [Abscondita terminalis]|nr:hypothetical protein FQR65_LT00406 [Abscondita terminalis]